LPKEKYRAINPEDKVDRIAQIIHRIIETEKDKGDATLTAVLRFLASIDEFNQRFGQGSSDPDSFISITELENLALRLLEDHKKLSSELIKDKLNGLDQKTLISKKKRSTLKEG
jgi:hypothetical protein